MGAVLSWWQPDRIRYDGLDDLRKEVAKCFNGQKLLLVGKEGCGKSSLINSFGMVLHLGDPGYTWKEWAPIGPKGASVTMTFRKYHQQLYSNQRLRQQLLGNKSVDLCPVFFDTAGFSSNDRVPEALVLATIASGKLKENTNLREILTPEYSHEEAFQSLKQNNDLHSWSILFVVSADADVSKEMAKVCYDAWEILEKAGEGIRVFALVTGLDKLNPDIRKSTFEELKRKLTTMLRISETRVYQAPNFTPQNIDGADMKLKVDVDQRELLLRALKGILSPDHTPEWKLQASASAH